MLNIHEYISRIELFSGLSAESSSLLSSICRPKECRAKEQLFLEGQPGQHVFFLISGGIQLSKCSADGKEIVIKIINPGELFAEVILFEKQNYPVNALALADSKLLQISKDGMFQLLNQTDFRNDFIAALMRKQRYLKERIHFLTAFNIEERFRQFLKQQFGKQSEISCPLSKKEIAAALGVTPESLSRLLLRLQQQQLLQWKGQKITVDDGFW